MEHILFLTGTLASKSLERVMQSIKGEEISYEIQVLPFAVAALMTTDMIFRHLDTPKLADRIIIPGLSIGDIDEVGKRLGIRVERGPKDLKDLPVFFGQGAHAPDLSQYTARIFAEIVDAPDLSIQEILKQADLYRTDGADIIDLGCLPGRDFPHLADAVKTLVAENFTVSVDSVDPKQLICGAQAGARYLLSLNESTLWVAEEVDAVPILIPEQPDDIDSLYRIIDIMQKKGKPFIADCIVDPIHFGFVSSIVRYHKLRADYPNIEIMMGIGNLSELTEADTAGINTIMLGMMSELGINNLLTTQVSPHARRCVAELNLARRIMYRAREDHSLPKGYHTGLMSLHNRDPFPYSDDEVQEISTQIKDPNFRIQVTETGIHIYNGDGLYTATEPFALFDNLPTLHDNAPHAYYIGVELGRAQIAWQLGNRYVQDQELDWGCAYHPVNNSTSDQHTRYQEESSTSKARKKLRRQQQTKKRNSDDTDEQ
jgi:hypothetical protein